MKRAFIFLLLFSSVFTAIAQENTKNMVIESESSIDLPSGKINKLFIRPRIQSQLLKSAQTNEASFEVTYINFPEEAKKAFEYALSIWKSQISSTVPIRVRATWESFNNSALALSRPSTFYINFKGAQISDVYYPIALAEKLSGQNLNSADADIICSFNNKYSWYFGTDGNTPTSKYDFVTAVLHELVHGFGFSGFFKDNGQNGYFDNSSNLPSIYDYYLFNNQNQQLADNNIFHSPSNNLHKQLTSNAVKFYSPDKTDGSEQTADWVYAPSTWSEGASIYHLKTGNGLMDAYMNKGEAIHAAEESTLEMLDEMGWNSVVFDFDELKDIEEAVSEIPVQVGFLSGTTVDNSKMKITFSKDFFVTTNSIEMQFDASLKKFSGNLPLDFFQGNLQYYFSLETSTGKSYTLPSNAPSHKFVLRIGPDYSAPVVEHNPVKIISKNEPLINFEAKADDNIGINSVKIEYKLNGVLQEPVSLTNDNGDIYKGALDLKNQSLSGNTFQYRVIAEDNSLRGNKRTLPSSGFYNVDVFHPKSPVYSYETDFDNNTSDFTGEDYSISTVPGFSSSVLHTNNPYSVSKIDSEKNNLITQLRTPVILTQGGQMSFDEVVLVEPGQPNTSYNDEMFWDYVIVEGSKDNGKTWLPLTDGYDSSSDQDWYDTFTSSIVNNNSTASGQENLLRNHTIYLTENTGFSEGDTVVFRFRLASDKSVSGWGWAIDNLEIQKGAIALQKGATTDSEMFADADNINMYPNPCTNSFYIDCSDFQDTQNIQIIVTDMLGKIVYDEAVSDDFFASKNQVDMSDKKPGMYLVNVKYGNLIVSKNKIIKK